jgi:predicted cobalt transporter CbtA
VIFNHGGGKFWFYWIAPLLMLGVGVILIALTLGYWLKVMRLEVKGRPRSD